MPQPKDNVDAQLRAIGEFNRFMVRQEVQLLPEILQSTERIFALTSGRFRKNQNWLVVVTNKRMLCLQKSFLSTKQVELPISQISGIGHETGFPWGSIVATTSGGAEVLDCVVNQDVSRIAIALSSLVALNHNNPANLESEYDRILAELAAGSAPQKAGRSMQFGWRSVVVVCASFVLGMYLLAKLNPNPDRNIAGEGQKASELNYPGPMDLKWGADDRSVREQLIKNGFTFSKRSKDTNRNFQSSELFSEVYRGTFADLPTEDVSASFSKDGLVAVTVFLKKGTSTTAEAIKHLMEIKYGSPSDANATAVGEMAVWRFRNDTCVMVMGAQSKAVQMTTWTFLKSSAMKALMNHECNAD